ncbi:uncharacterized protein LOC127848487 isoform X3 [Dreissena polymorpha]|uniref:uncharacterized protein LOC127848487 isoform X2 n=1 Tax=Dreissena polymorpha TaxID=45954 RepID=UPI0022640611|nr:uncharacterized protein LOC127848487 isoform X2 [Dreissena polymorpha]XP_052236940.1 uncharacterized protein LOC127848487 isoform X3 [Dreissena polymorpha]
MKFILSRQQKRYGTPLVLICFIIDGLYLFLESQKAKRLKLIAEKSLWLDELQRESHKNSAVEGFRRKHNSKPGFLHHTNITNVNITADLPFSKVELLINRYFQQKQITCDNDVRLGFQHDGGWNVCMTPPFTLTKPCLVYSFGIGNDWRFEDDLFEYYGCTVMAFDPSMNRPPHNRTAGMRFKPEGLCGMKDCSNRKWQMKTFRQHLKEAGHLDRIIDYLKFDVEYSEWPAIEEMLQDDSLHNVKQIAFEAHLKHPPYEPLDTYLTKGELINKFQILKQLEKFGFRKFNYRSNPFGHYFCKINTDDYCSVFYDINYLNINFVEPKHFEDFKNYTSKV